MPDGWSGSVVWDGNWSGGGAWDGCSQVTIRLQDYNNPNTPRQGLTNILTTDVHACGGCITQSVGVDEEIHWPVDTEASVEISPGGPVIHCVGVGELLSFTGSGTPQGGDYFWFSSGGTPISSSNNSYNVKYDSSGVKTVFLSYDTQDETVWDCVYPVVVQFDQVEVRYKAFISPELLATPWGHHFTIILKAMIEIFPIIKVPVGHSRNALWT